MATTLWSVEMKRRIVCALIAGLAPALGSAQVPLDSDGGTPHRVELAAIASVALRDASPERPEAPIPVTWALQVSSPARSNPFLNDRGASATARVQPWHAVDARASSWQATGRSRGSVMGWTIAIGIGAGIAISGVAASRYGENEGGQFCARCFAEWSAISIPVGAGAGAAVGYLIDKARR